ncbi:DUF4399 domain-containing protein [Solitalea koreensis]|uniref:DUF4399 domain-containing protein n=1 Tax=Solitalea koreensis TaxID=543615 RepID=A0A521D2I5_9SPHI|nr:DUF4399 domain-containing protein [Solitalea koreensis]SMO65110.1 protein of unknown function [Solitalea koreensis]
MKTNCILLALGLALVSCNTNKKPKEEASDTIQQKSAEHAEMPAAVDTTIIKAGQEVYFVNLKDGETVKNPVKVEMGVKGMTVEPLGAKNPDKGHHHIIIDGSFIPAGQVVPADSTHIHFGKGQTETELTLTPGKHSLTLQFADGMHTSYGVRMSKTITVDVSSEMVKK